MKRRIEAIVLAAVLLTGSMAVYSTENIQREDGTEAEQDTVLPAETAQNVSGSADIADAGSEKGAGSTDPENVLNTQEQEVNAVTTGTEQEDEIISPEDGQEYVSGKVILVFEGEDDYNSVSVQDLMSGYSVSDTEILADSTGYEGCAVEITLADDSQAQVFMEDMQTLPQVASVQRDFVYRLMDDYVENEETGAEESVQMSAVPETTTINDKAAKSQYYLNSWDETFASSCGANLYEAWDLARSEHTVSIAVLDTGCRMTHEDLAANINTSLAYDFVNDLSGTAVSDIQGHGTHVCGIAGAVANNTVGVAGTSYNASIIPLQVFEKEGTSVTCSTSTLLEAIDYLDEKVESGELTDLHVINMSLGGYDDKSSEDLAFEDALRELRNEHNVAIVCAGGNGDKQGNPMTDNNWPSDFEECIAVTSLSAKGVNAHWSDYNECKDISAPGVGIYSTTRTSDSSYGNMSGSSMSSPLVAGIFALLFAADPDLTVDEALEAVQSTAHPVSQASDYHTETETGSPGAIDAAAALKWIMSEPLNEDGSVRAAYDETTKTLRIEGNGEVSLTTETELPWNDVREEVEHVVITGSVSGTLKGLFSEMTNLTDVDLSGWDASGVTNVREMFANCSSLVFLDMSNLNFSDLTDAAGFLSGCSGLHIICTDNLKLPAEYSISLPDTYYVYDADTQIITGTAAAVLVGDVELVLGDAGHNWEMTREVSGSGMYRKECSACQIKTDSDLMFSDMKGDANQDGRISAADITAINRHVKGIEQITDEQSLLNADVDGDGNITCGDCVLVAEYLARLIDEL